MRQAIGAWFTREWCARSRLDRISLILLAVTSALIGQWLLTHLHTVGVVLALNQLVNPQWVIKKTGVRWVNNLKFGANVMRSYDDQYKQSGAKMGYTVNARLPWRTLVQKGQALIPQPVIDNIVPITLTDQANTGMEFSTASLTMEVDDYNDKCIGPAVDALSNVVDFDGLSRSYKQVSQTVGTPGVVPGSTGTLPQAANAVYLAAKTKLDNSAIRAGNRIAMISSDMHAQLANANVAIFNPVGTISENFKAGQFGREALGVGKWFLDQNVFTHTVGALGGTPVVNGANQVGNSIITNGWSTSVTGILKFGDVIQYGSVGPPDSGVMAVNPLSYISTGKLRDFTVTADVNSDSGGNATIPIDPPITTTGAYQTVSRSPNNGEAVLIFRSASAYASTQTPQGLIYDPEAFALVVADLEVPGGQWVAERVSNKALAVSIRFIKSYDAMTDLSPGRLDILYGWQTVRTEAACRVAS